MVVVASSPDSHPKDSQCNWNDFVTMLATARCFFQLRDSATVVDVENPAFDSENVFILGLFPAVVCE